MSTQKYLIISFNVFIALLIYGFSYGQVEDSLFIGKDTSDVIFVKVILDSKIFYRNQKTNEFISRLEYLKKETPKDKIYKPDNYSNEYWQTNKVNPYKDIVMSYPFKIEFDQMTFTHPVDNKLIITSRYGRRRRGKHRGIDIDLVTGDFVRSVLPGKVRFVGYSTGHGKTVIVRHANEVETVYAHLSAYNVKVNDLIFEGDILGFGGNTGNSRGSHLHLEVRYKGVCIHPEYVFNFDGRKSIQGSSLWVTKGLKSPNTHSSYRKSKLKPHFTEKEAIAAQQVEPRYYRVRKGDTLSHIASLYRLRLREICSLNAISKNSILSIGQIIQIR